VETRRGQTIEETVIDLICISSPEIEIKAILPLDKKTLTSFFWLIPVEVNI